jgi:hypothetical protein
MAHVGRFERDDSEASNLPETLGAATEGLRSTIELEVAKIVEDAQARAAEIEDQALEKASRIDQESARRLDSAFAECRQRLADMLSQIDAVELSLNESVHALRAEAQQLTGDLSGAATDPFAVEEPLPPPEEEAQPEAPVAEPAVTEPAEAEAEVEAEVEAPAEPAQVIHRPDGADSAVRDLIRQQLQMLADDGRTRADAERLLLRFNQGEQYFDLLDEIYSKSTPGRRGLWPRRKVRA